MSHRLLTRAATSRTALLALSAGLGTALVLSGCGGPGVAAPADVPSPITRDEAVDIAENALQGYNDGDYATWSRDWSPAMTSAISEEAFLAFREAYQGELGDWLAIEDVTGAPGESDGVYRWTFDVEFENADYVVWFAFAEGSPLVEGIQFAEPGA